MSNPFEALNISDDEEDQFVETNNPQKIRKSKPSILFSPQRKKIIEKARHQRNTKTHHH